MESFGAAIERKTIIFAQSNNNFGLLRTIVNHAIAYTKNSVFYIGNIRTALRYRRFVETMAVAYLSLTCLLSAFFFLILCSNSTIACGVTICTVDHEVF